MELTRFLTEDNIVKTKGDLVMYGYKMRESLTEDTKLLNNLICDKNNNILHYSGKFMDEKSIENLQNISGVYTFPEGTVMRVFNYKNEWKVATNRCLDATDSYFTGRVSFMDMFNSVIDKHFFDALDKEMCYVFILIHQDARIVLPVEEDNIILASTTNLKTLETKFNEEYLIQNCDVKEVLNRHHSIIVKDGDDYFRVFSDTYLRMRELKKLSNNNPVLRMIELITKESENTREYLSYFPEHESVYIFVEKTLDYFIKSVYNDYIALKIKKEKLVFPKTYFNLLYKIHGDYINTGCRTDLETVKRYVYETDSNNLRYMMFSIFKNKIKSATNEVQHEEVQQNEY